jgi:hypothetical protein
MTEGNYSNVGHRGPVHKGLGAMNPCDNLQEITAARCVIAQKNADLKDVTVSTEEIHEGCTRLYHIKNVDIGSRIEGTRCIK